MTNASRRITFSFSAGILVSLAGSARGAGSVDAEIRAGALSHTRASNGAEECAHCRSLAPGAEAAPPPGRIPFDEATGRRLANFPPHRIVDINHMRLDLSIDDMNTPTMNGVETLTVTPVGWALNELNLNARGLKISRVESPGRTASFEYDGEMLKVQLDPAPAPGERTTVITTYSVNNPPAGLIWTPESSAWPGRPAQIHTQGQPQTNSYWFPCHDFPNERLTSELRVTVPAGFTVCSNGRLIGHDNIIRTTKDKLGGSVMLPAESFHWMQDEKAGGNHVNYLVSMVVGKFDIVDVGSQSLPVPVYVPRGRGKDVPGTFGCTPAMIEALGARLDEPYPWCKYAQCVVWNFAAGGMENTSATTLYDTALIAPAALAEFDRDGLISHELGHQWFGDLLTCNSWEHVWLNEGFATYMSALWAEKRPAPEGGTNAYQTDVRGFFDAIIANDKPEAPYVQPMVSKVYDHPWQAFRRPANPYSKGASILHMLRARLGDEVFFRGIATYVDRFKHREVETSDLRKTLEEVSGDSLEQFFAQWCMRPGVPTLQVETAFDPATGELRVDVEQTQNIDADNPAFEFTLPVWIDTGSGTGTDAGTWLKIDVQGRKATGKVTLSGVPRIIAVDPGMSVLAGMKIAVSQVQWLAQLADGPTYASRVQAARLIGAAGFSEESARKLFAIAMDRSAYPPFRGEAARALAAMKDGVHVETLAAAQLTPPSVREAAVQALGEVAMSGDDSESKAFRARAVGLLAELAERDPSVKARAAAVAALGRLGAADRIGPVLLACRTDSQDDVLRQTGLDALGDLGAANQAQTVIALTREGVLSRTRAKATETLGKVGGQGRDAAFKRLVELLSDREVRVRAAARQGLADLGDPRGVAELEKAATRLGDADRADAKDCLRRLNQSLAPAAAKSPG